MWGVGDLENLIVVTNGKFPDISRMDATWMRHGCDMDATFEVHFCSEAPLDIKRPFSAHFDEAASDAGTPVS